MSSEASTSDQSSDEDHERLDPVFLRGIIEGMCDLWDSTLLKEVAYREDIDAERATGITTQAHHAVRMARALLLVESATSGIEILPLARLIMECGVTAAWLLVTPGAGHTLLRDGARQRKNAHVDMAKLEERSQADLSPGHQQALEAFEALEAAEGPRSFVFEARCKELVGGDGWYLLYRVFSSQSHSGMGVVDFYIREALDSPIGVSFDPDAIDEDRVSVLGVAAAMLMLALNADEQARLYPRHEMQIRVAAMKLGVPCRIVRKDGFEFPDRAQGSGTPDAGESS